MAYEVPVTLIDPELEDEGYDRAERDDLLSVVVSIGWYADYLGVPRRDLLRYLAESSWVADAARAVRDRRGGEA